MLCSRPARAHAPIVSGRKWTFAARRMSDASVSVIQSAAAIPQSPVEAAGFGLSAEVVSFGLDPASELVADSSLDDDFFDLLAA